MKYLIPEIMEAVVAQISDREFDSHTVIRELMRRHPQAYVRELYEHRENEDPIHVTHAQIGRILTQLKSIKKLNRVDSPNVRSQDLGGTENQRWERI